MRIHTNAKINLTLDITGKRNDGYHLIESIFTPIPFCDVLDIELSNDIRVTTTMSYIPTDSRNLAYKAAELFFNETRIKGGAKIHITKNIPIRAGLGGGSSNAAGVLTALNNLYNANLSIQALSDIGVKIGADVPFHILNKTVLAEGIGEILTHLPPPPPCTMAVIIPDFGVSTVKAFNHFNIADENILRPNTKMAIEALQNQDLTMLGHAVGNALESSVASLFPKINEMKTVLLSAGAICASMTGSGSCVFGIFPPNSAPPVRFANSKVIMLNI